MYNLSAGDHYFWFLILKYQFGLQKEPKADVSYAICNYYQYCLKPTVHGKKTFNPFKHNTHPEFTILSPSFVENSLYIQVNCKVDDVVSGSIFSHFRYVNNVQTLFKLFLQTFIFHKINSFLL